MKVRLLNDGGYRTYEHARFPVEVEARYDASTDTYDVSSHELIRVGFVNSSRCELCFAPWDGECEVIE